MLQSKYIPVVSIMCIGVKEHSFSHINISLSEVRIISSNLFCRVKGTFRNRCFCFWNSLFGKLAYEKIFFSVNLLANSVYNSSMAYPSKFTICSLVIISFISEFVFGWTFRIYTKIWGLPFLNFENGVSSFTYFKITSTISMTKINYFVISMTLILMPDFHQISNKFENHLLID